MNSIKKYISSLGRGTRVLILALAVVVAGAGITQAATTISTNISTAGTLGVTGQTTLVNASSTVLSSYNAFFGGSATSTFGTDGSLTLAAGLSGTSGSFSTTLSVTATTTTASLTASGSATLASTTATTLKVGHVGTGMTRIVSGYCVTGSITIPATNASSTQTYTNCTPSGGTSVISSGDRVFLQATSSLPHYVVIQSASSTASGGLINVGLTNFSTTTYPAAAVYAFNFWAFQ